MNVIKRDGSEVAFEIENIANAVRRAAKEVLPSLAPSEEEIYSIANDVTSQCESVNRAFSVEEIQELVETAIMDHGFFEVAKRYIRYRYERNQRRSKNTIDDVVLSLVEYENEAVKQENSNKNPEIIPTQRDYIAGEVSKDLTRRKFMPTDIMSAHDEGIIHFHDADYFIQHSHNCFSGKTRFVTSDGVRSFVDCKDGTTVKVLAKDGVFRMATVHKYGKQQLFDVTLKNQRQSKVVTCTPNHRWILKDGSVTTSLCVGDKLYGLRPAVLPELSEASYELLNSFCLGFIVGDGCDHGDEIQVRLCGDKKKYIEVFQKAGYRTSINNDIVMAYKKGLSKQAFLNGMAWKYMPLECKQMLFAGLYAADGATKYNKLSTTDERVFQLINDISAIAGYHITSVNLVIRDTNYKLDSKLYEFRFTTSTPDNWCWGVQSIVPHHTSATELFDVWCVEEPITHSFTLEGGIVTGNCDLVNLDDMLNNGTVISGTLIERPHSFSTACNIATQIIAQVASSQFGGQTITLSHLAPFVDISRRKIREDVVKEMQMAGATVSNVMIDKIVEERVHQEVQRGVQTIQYQVITLMTTNGQAPFISVFMYLNEVPDGQTRRDLAMIIEEVLRQRFQGVKNESGVWITPAFPKLLYCLDENNVYPDSEYFYLTKLAAKCTARRMVPDYISAKVMRRDKINKNGHGDVYPCMGCRSFLTTYVDENGEPKYYGRFNQGVVTINLVDVALSSGGDFDKFWEIFEERLELCHRALRLRHERLLGTPSDVAPILWQYGALARLKKGEVIDKLLYNGYSTISLGYAGLYECTKYMTGVSHTDADGKPFALAVMQKMNDKTSEWKAAENIDYSLYGTPLESTTYKFAKCLQNRFGIIKDVTDHNYITNSYHVNVREKIDAFTKLAFESEFQKLSPGGAVSYCEVPDLQDNPEVIISLIQFIYENIMYAELNTKSDYCQVCGYDGEIETVEESGKILWECPVCHNRDQNKLNVARRTCGYIGTQFWNQGRTQEIKERVLHL